MGPDSRAENRLVELKAEGEQRSRSEEARKSLEAGAQRYERIMDPSRIQGIKNGHVAGSMCPTGGRTRCNQTESGVLTALVTTTVCRPQQGPALAQPFQLSTVGSLNLKERLAGTGKVEKRSPLIPPLFWNSEKSSLAAQQCHLQGSDPKSDGARGHKLATVLALHAFVLLSSGETLP